MGASSRGSRGFSLRIVLSALIATAVLLALMASAALWPAGASEHTAVIYVDVSAAGNDDGTSWEHAFTDLQDALTDADTLLADVDDPPALVEIWVAEGTYRPTSGDDRNARFELRSNVALYGGFPTGGGDGTFAARGWETFATILSGDIGAPDDASDNSYTVVYGADVNASAVLDGFSVTGGNANDFTALSLSPERNGGGLYLTNSSPTITNTVISGNFAGSGGGLHLTNSSPTITNSTISGNQAGNNGGGLFLFSSDATISNSAISGNFADVGGGLVLLFDSSPTISNSVISGNAAGFNGGGLVLSNSNATITNSAISGNQAGTVGGGLVLINDSSASINNSIVWGNSATTGNALFLLADSSATLDHSMIDDDVCGDPPLADVTCNDPVAGPPQFVAAEPATNAPTTDGDYRLLFGSPAIDAGDNDLYPEDAPATDLDGNPRIVNDVIDLGPYEFQIEVDDPDPAELLADLIDDVGEMEIQRGVKIGILASLNAAQSSIVNDDGATACDQLQAAANLVTAQSGKHLSVAEADALLAQIAAIRAALDC